MNWTELLKQPQPGDHLVQVYQDDGFLGETVRAYIGGALERGEAAVIIATPQHRAQFGFQPSDAMRILDAEETLARFMVDGMPDWTKFHAIVGGLIAELRLRYPAVRAYGEMVNLLWLRNERDAAIDLEKYWNDLGRLQTFSLLCAYYMDNLDPAAYNGPLDCICGLHTHFIPARDYADFNEAVAEISQEIYEPPLSKILLSLAAHRETRTHMPTGQATLMWLKRNMPRSSDKVLSALRERLAVSPS